MAFNSFFRLCARSSVSASSMMKSAGPRNSAITGHYKQIQDFSSMKAAQGYPSASAAKVHKKTHQQDQMLQSDSDSDSETEFVTHSKKDGIEFWRRKMRTFHGILDINKDGVISYDDYQLLVNRFINLGHLSPQHEQEFRKLIQKMWEERWGSIDEYNLITTEQYLEDMHHVISDKELRKKIHYFLPYLFETDGLLQKLITTVTETIKSDMLLNVQEWEEFDYLTDGHILAVDNDKDGSITIEEFKLFFQCLGLSSEDAVVSFHVIDANNDGHLSSKEFVKLGKEFFLSKDQKKPSKMFWGPLI